MKSFAPPPQPSPASRERIPRVIGDPHSVAVPREAGEGGGLGAFRNVLVALGLLGAALRLYAARGDLWLDEVWTLDLLERAHSFADVFIGLHHDNNHVANSAWLYLLGPDAPVPLMRLAAVLLGSLAIPAAAAASRRYCDAAGLLAAFVFAVSYFFVHYGSEARGYAGMTLAVLLAYAVADAILVEGADWRRLSALAAAIAFGTFSHLTMVEASGALALTAMLRGRRSVGGAVAIVTVIGLASLPALGCFVYGALAPDFQVGAMVPLTPGIFAEGVAGMARATLGFPRGVDDFAIVGASALLGLGLLAVLPAERRIFPAIAVFGLPLLHIAAALPSQQYPRFHSTAAIGLALLAAEGCAALWRAGAGRRVAAILLLAGFVAGDAPRLADFFRYGRGHYVDAVRIMGERGGEARYAVDFARGETKAVVAYHARRLGVAVAAVSLSDWCASPPDYLLIVDLPDGASAYAARRSAGPDACRASFVRRGVFPASGLSGFAWTLYERE